MIQVFHFSVGISDTATTVQVAVQTPPSRRRGAAKTQTKLVKKIKKYDFGLDIDPIDTKLRPQSNQIMPQGKKFKQILFHQLFTIKLFNIHVKYDSFQNHKQYNYRLQLYTRTKNQILD